MEGKLRVFLIVTSAFVLVACGGRTLDNGVTGTTPGGGQMNATNATAVTLVVTPNPLYLKGPAGTLVKGSFKIKNTGTTKATINKIHSWNNTKIHVDAAKNFCTNAVLQPNGANTCTEGFICYSVPPSGQTSSRVTITYNTSLTKDVYVYCKKA